MHKANTDWSAFHKKQVTCQATLLQMFDHISLRPIILLNFFELELATCLHYEMNVHL